MQFSLALWRTEDDISFVHGCLDSWGLLPYHFIHAEGGLTYTFWKMTLMDVYKLNEDQPFLSAHVTWMRYSKGLYWGYWDSNFFNIKLTTAQVNPRYWSHRMILDFRVSLGTSRPRNHCFEAWTNRWSIESFDKPCPDSSSPPDPSSSKTSFSAFSISASHIPFQDSA